MKARFVAIAQASAHDKRGVEEAYKNIKCM